MKKVTFHKNFVFGYIENYYIEKLFEKICCTILWWRIEVTSAHFSGVIIMTMV